MVDLFKTRSQICYIFIYYFQYYHYYPIIDICTLLALFTATVLGLSTGPDHWATVGKTLIFGKALLSVFPSAFFRHSLRGKMHLFWGLVLNAILHSFLPTLPSGPPPLPLCDKRTGQHDLGGAVAEGGGVSGSIHSSVCARARVFARVCCMWQRYRCILAQEMKGGEGRGAGVSGAGNGSGFGGRHRKLLLRHSSPT